MGPGHEHSATPTPTPEGGPPEQAGGKDYMRVAAHNWCTCTHVPTHAHTHTHSCTHTYACTYMHICTMPAAAALDSLCTGTGERTCTYRHSTAATCARHSLPSERPATPRAQQEEASPYSSLPLATSQGAQSFAARHSAHLHNRPEG